MVTVQFRGMEFVASEYSDRDVIRLSAALSDTTIDATTAEKNVCSLLRAIFPSLPPEWTQGDRCVLHSTELAPATVRLQEALLSSETFIDSLAGLKAMPGVNAIAGKEIHELQQKAKGKGVKPRPPRSNQINHYR